MFRHEENVCVSTCVSVCECVCKCVCVPGMGLLYSRWAGASGLVEERGQLVSVCSVSVCSACECVFCL